MTQGQKIRISKTRKDTISLRGIYKIHKKKYGLDMSFDTYKKIISVMSSSMIKKLIDGTIVSLPGNLGSFIVNEVECKMHSHEFGINKTATTYPIDSKATIKAVKAGKGKLIYDLSFTSIFKFRWIKGSFKNSTVYYLDTSDDFNSKLYHNAKRKLR